jgi:hypothetical protein
MAGKYDQPTDRDSAYEILARRAAAAADAAEETERAAEQAEAAQREFNTARRYSGTRVSRSSARSTKTDDTFGSAMTEAVIKELKGTTGRRLVRGILGSLFMGR